MMDQYEPEPPPTAPNPHSTPNPSKKMRPPASHQPDNNLLVSSNDTLLVDKGHPRVTSTSLPTNFSVISSTQVAGGPNKLVIKATGSGSFRSSPALLGGLSSSEESSRHRSVSGKTFLNPLERISTLVDDINHTPSSTLTVGGTTTSTTVPPPKPRFLTSGVRHFLTPRRSVPPLTPISASGPFITSRAHNLPASTPPSSVETTRAGGVDDEDEKRRLGLLIRGYGQQGQGHGGFPRSNKKEPSPTSNLIPNALKISVKNKSIPSSSLVSSAGAHAEPGIKLHIRREFEISSTDNGNHEFERRHPGSATPTQGGMGQSPSALCGGIIRASADKLGTSAGSLAVAAGSLVTGAFTSMIRPRQKHKKREPGRDPGSFVKPSPEGDAPSSSSSSLLATVIDSHRRREVVLDANYSYKDRQFSSDPDIAAVVSFKKFPQPKIKLPCDSSSDSPAQKLNDFKTPRGRRKREPNLLSEDDGSGSGGRPQRKRKPTKHYVTDMVVPRLKIKKKNEEANGEGDLGGGEGSFDSLMTIKTEPGDSNEIPMDLSSTMPTATVGVGARARGRGTGRGRGRPRGSGLKAKMDRLAAATLLKTDISTGEVKLDFTDSVKGQVKVEEEVRLPLAGDPIVNEQLSSTKIPVTPTLGRPRGSRGPRGRGTGTPRGSRGSTRGTGERRPRGSGLRRGAGTRRGSTTPSEPGTISELAPPTQVPTPTDSGTPSNSVTPSDADSPVDCKPLRGSETPRGLVPKGARGSRGGRRILKPKRSKKPKEPVIKKEPLPVLNFEEETRMSADIRPPLVAIDKTPGTPLGVIIDEESRASNVSSTSTSTAAKLKRFTKDPIDERKPTTAETLFEYQWPQDDTKADYYFLQEQVSEFLGAKSFRRKYPELRRRVVEIVERDFLREQKVVSETQCDLGLTAVNSTDVLDIMFNDFPEKYEEYRKVVQERRELELTRNKVAITTPGHSPIARDRSAEFMRRIVKSCAKWNNTFNRERKEDRSCSYDLQTGTLNFPAGQHKVLPPEATKVGFFPVGVLPGQYSDSYKEYTAAELKYLPLNTVVFGPVYENGNSVESEDSGSDSDDSSSSDESSSSSSDEESELKNSSQEEHFSSSGRLISKKEADALDSQGICKTCNGDSTKNKDRRAEILIHCAKCDSANHPTCLELSLDMVPFLKKYDWQCTDCKNCIECNDPADEDKMLFCDCCDRGYHIYCVGLRKVPPGRWHCSYCSICYSCNATTPSPDDRMAEWYHEFKKAEKGLKSYLHSLCISCHKIYKKGQYCPSCLKCHLKLDDKNLLECRNCEKWVHKGCIKRPLQTMFGFMCDPCDTAFKAKTKLPSQRR